MRLHSQTNASKLTSLPPTRLGLLGGLEVRLAQNQNEIMQALEMREQVFGMPASINVDRFDAICDHLLVVDNTRFEGNSAGKIVGTYRLIRNDQAALVDGFYSATEFNIEPMLEENSKLNFLEFGRSCVLPNYRGKRTIELLWAGSWAYIIKHKIDILFGCASFSGIDPNAHREGLSFLHHYAPVDKKLDTQAMPAYKAKFDLMEKSEIDTKRAIKSLPPIIKGYLRVGARFSTQIAVDREFNTVDILTVLPVKNIDERYINYYGANGERHSCS